MENKIWNATELYAYLDGELLPVQEKALKAELEINQSLQEQLAQQRQTVELLQTLPLRETPRNYLLTPEMVRVAAPRPKLRRRRFTLWSLRLATTFSALLFVVALGLQFTPLTAIPQPLAQAPAMMEQEVTAEMEEAVVMEKMVEVEKVVEVVASPEPRELPAAEVAAEEAPVMDSALLPTATAAAKNGIGGEEEFAAPLTLGAGEAATAELELCSLTEGDAECGSVSEPQPETPPATAGAEGSASWQNEEEGPPSQRSFSPWWLVGTLGLVTLGFASATWWSARRN
ncbi:MAG: hypothetical protein U9Q70_09715 [Chloroflexota bacterium]|nr:hypothetical protein [Chloroflexota bacterium]